MFGKFSQIILNTSKETNNQWDTSHPSMDSHDEIYKFLKKYSNNKAPGSDDISYEF